MHENDRGTPMWHRRVACLSRALSFVVLLIGFASSTEAEDLPLSGVANPETRWYEHISDAFLELGRDPDGFYLISELPSYEPVGQVGGVVGFPNGANFDLGELNYDSSLLTGHGVETAAVVGYEVEFDVNIADDDAIANRINNLGYATTITDVAGTIQLTNGIVTSLDFEASVTFSYDFPAVSEDPLDYHGSLTFSGDRFVLFVDDTVLVTANNTPLRYTWDSTGTVDQVFKPSPIDGDYDGSGVADVDDYELWRLEFGTAGPRADGNRDGFVDAADYTVWRDAFEDPVELGAPVEVPEPFSAVLVTVMAMNLPIRTQAGRRPTPWPCEHDPAG
ncbi:MAG: hypothetical protein AAGJ46_13370 [Planctomycetota bacterium]